MSVVINGLQIDDNVNYLTEEVNHRSIPTRNVLTQPISRRPGVKLTATEWQQKEITIKGRVFGSSAADLRTRVDTLQQNFAVQSLALSIDSDRTYTATLEKLDIPTQFYQNTMVQYDATFLCADPFAYGSLITASGTVVSGTTTFNGSITISGTVFAEPVITINPTGANAGNSGIKGVKISYTPTGENVTVSGILNYSSNLQYNYLNFTVTNSGVVSDYTGIFSRWQPGTNNFSITITSGVANGYNWSFAYQPRYYE